MLLRERINRFLSNVSNDIDQYGSNSPLADIFKQKILNHLTIQLNQQFVDEMDRLILIGITADEQKKQKMLVKQSREKKERLEEIKNDKM